MLKSAKPQNFSASKLSWHTECMLGHIQWRVMISHILTLTYLIAVMSSLASAVAINTCFTRTGIGCLPWPS